MHGGAVLLAVNVWVLWDAGRVVERLYGNGTFLVLYLLSGLGGSLVHLAMSPDTVAAGASAAVFGVLGALVAFRRGCDLECEDECALRSWLLSIAENKVREAIRHHLHVEKRSVDREVTQGGAAPPHVDTGATTPSRVVMRREISDLALDALKRLPPDQARVLRYSLQEHLTVKQMAAHLERSENAVRKLHGRAIVSFRKELEHLRHVTRG